MRRRNDHKSFYCPNGHTQYFPQKSEQDRLKDQLSAAQQELLRIKQRNEILEANNERDRVRCKRTKANLKGQITKLKKKVK